MNSSVFGDRSRTMLIPVQHVGDRNQAVEIVRPGGPGGLFALARATGLAVIPAGGARSDRPVTRSAHALTAHHWDDLLLREGS